MKISEHFSRDEFACQCLCGFDSVDVELLNVLEELRNHFGKPIRITSGNRCRTHNNEIGGAISSQHTKGLAADIQVRDTSSVEVYEYLDSKYPNKYGLGKYNFWTHIDVKPGPARRWDKT